MDVCESICSSSCNRSDEYKLWSDRFASDKLDRFASDKLDNESLSCDFRDFNRCGGGKFDGVLLAVTRSLDGSDDLALSSDSLVTCFKGEDDEYSWGFVALLGGLLLMIYGVGQGGCARNTTGISCMLLFNSQGIVMIPSQTNPHW
jgi:hypothetical protein